MMEPLARLWQDRYSCFLLDLPGFGNSPLPCGYTVENYVRDIEEFIRHRALSNVVLIGHSFGGKLAFFMKKSHPEYEVIGIAPSIVKQPFRLQVFLKATAYRLGKKLHLPVHRIFKGSRDYRNSSGFLRITFLNVVHAYLAKQEIASLSGGVIIAATSDTEVSAKVLKRSVSLNSKIRYEEISGNHFAYLENLFQVYQIIEEVLRGSI